MKKLVLLLVAGLAFSTSVLGETTDTEAEKAAKPVESKDGGAAPTVTVERGLFGGLIKIRSQKEIQKVDGLIAENLHTKCDPNNTQKECWRTGGELARQKGKSSRSSVYTDPNSIKEHGKNNRRVKYFDTKNQTEVYVFEVSDGWEGRLIDDYITSTPNFVATKDRF